MMFSKEKTISISTILNWIRLTIISTAFLCSQLMGADNVIFIVADDLNCAIGPYQDKSAITPNLDKLAARGVVFDRAYCQQAVCNPSRSSFLTGLRPGKVGVDDLRKYFRSTAPNGDALITLPQHFKNHGYFCQNIGKMFHNMGETQDRRSWSIDEVLFKGTHAADTFFANQPWTFNQKPKYKSPVTEAHQVPDTVYRDGQIANLAVSTIKDHAESKSKQPFFLAVGFWRPHLPFVAPKKYWDLYDPEALPLPTLSKSPDNAPTIALHNSREIKGYGKVPKDRSFTEAEIRHYRHGYYAAISFLDAQVGEILDALKVSGLEKKTIVVFTSDHGFHIGEHGLWGKTSNFELDARVPLIIADPELPAAHGKSTKSLAELIDLYPTLADLAGIGNELPENLDGVSLKPILIAPDASVKGAAFTRHQQPFYGNAKDWRAWGYSIRTERWRYTRWVSIKSQELIAQELYDHDADPHETQNVAADPEFKEAIQALSRKLNANFGSN